MCEVILDPRVQERSIGIGQSFDHGWKVRRASGHGIRQPLHRFDEIQMRIDGRGGKGLSRIPLLIQRQFLFQQIRRGAPA